MVNRNLNAAVAAIGHLKGILISSNTSSCYAVYRCLSRDAPRRQTGAERPRRSRSGCQLNAILPRSWHINVQQMLHHTSVTLAGGRRNLRAQARALARGWAMGSVGHAAVAGVFARTRINSAGRCSDRRRCFDSTFSLGVCRSIRTSTGRSRPTPAAENFIYRFDERVRVTRQRSSGMTATTDQKAPLSPNDPAYYAPRVPRDADPARLPRLGETTGRPGLRRRRSPIRRSTASSRTRCTIPCGIRSIPKQSKNRRSWTGPQAARRCRPLRHRSRRGRLCRFAVCYRDSFVAAAGMPTRRAAEVIDSMKSALSKSEQAPPSLTNRRRRRNYNRSWLASKTARRSAMKRSEVLLQQFMQWQQKAGKPRETEADEIKHCIHQTLTTTLKGGKI